MVASGEKMTIEASCTPPRRTSERTPARSTRNGQCGSGREDHRRHVETSATTGGAVSVGEHGGEIRVVDVHSRWNLRRLLGLGPAIGVLKLSTDLLFGRKIFRFVGLCPQLPDVCNDHTDSPCGPPAPVGARASGLK